MTWLPVLEDLTVDGYAMYPGTPAKQGLAVTLSPGLTLVLGANGLGKSTLVNMLFRLLTGPFDIQNPVEGGALGSRRIEARRLQSWESQTFALRVTDGARDATATLRFLVGDVRYVVTRNLATLQLLALSRDDARLPADEEVFQRQMNASAGVNGFGEWILLLRLLVFYFEDRRALVWDKTAQLQLLRILFLSPEMSASWAEQYREVLELDSLVRNMTYTLNKEERIVGKGETALVRAPEVRQQLDILGEAQTKEQELLDGLNDRLVDANSEREGARLAHLRAEQAVESARRSRERLELRVIEHAFPTGSETARYIIAQLVAEEICLTCSTVVPDYAIELHRRLETAACPVCNSPTATRSRSRVPRKLLARAESDLDSAEEILGSTKTRRERSEGEYVALLDQISELSARTAARDAEMGELTKRLPPEEVGVRDRRDSLNASKARLAGHRERLLRLREDFASVQLGINEIIAESAEQVKGAFATFAHGFLFEDCSLAWTVFRDRVGEGGMLIDFPAFQLDMSGASFSSPVRRSGPQFVSESQREFVDLAFKMALISVATGDAGTIVVDAPESSLDAVFVSRAADVLNRFAVSSDKKRLVITSNLIEGDLIPELLWRADIRSPRNSRILDLLRVAAPTAAIVAMHREYEEVRNRLFAKAREKLDE